MIQPSLDAQIKLKNWYLKNARSLPWRKTKDPYKIWISEVMLQQTVSAAVIPYFEKFTSKFPTVEALANAPLPEVLEMWSGLGYYSRARNLHKAAQALTANGFPHSYKELLQYPGFGPYTARSVASLAFGESVGVLDGNVIRILSRIHGLKTQWWKPQFRSELQTLSDLWVQNQDSSILNQAMMELGATICSPQNPSCLLCPLQKNCTAFKTHTTDQIPLKKLRRSKEIWSWNARLLVYKNKLGFAYNDYAPFLKNQTLFLGTAKQLSKAPAKFDYKHNITHHEIYVQTRLEKVKTLSGIPKSKVRWIPLNKIKSEVPQTLVQKAVKLHFPI